MATSGTVVTLEDIVGATSAMRLKLKKKGESLVNQKPSGSNGNDGSKQSSFEEKLRQKAKELMELVVENAQSQVPADLNDEPALLDGKARQEAIKKNEERFKAITENMAQMIRATEQIVIDEMIKIPLPDQPHVISFWESAQDFLGGVLDWLSSMFKYVLEKIKQGYRIVKNAIKGLFDTVCRFLGNIFKKKERESDEEQENERSVRRSN